MLLRQAPNIAFSQCALTQYDAISVSCVVDARSMPMPMPSCRESLPDRNGSTGGNRFDPRFMVATPDVVLFAQYLISCSSEDGFTCLTPNPGTSRW